MKFSKLFQKNICKLIFLSCVFNTMSSVAFAVAPSYNVRPTIKPIQPGAINIAHEGNLKSLIKDIVEKSHSNSYTLDNPSPALMRCYDRIARGDQLLMTGDVIDAMPELLNYAIAQYESKVLRAPRPQNPYTPGAVVGNIHQNFNEFCDAHKDDADLCDIITLLLIIKKQIGTVEDDVCCDSVLGVLGDACEILGMSISEYLLTIINTCTPLCCDEIIETITACCTSLHEDIDDLRCVVDCRLGEFVDCCECDCDNCGECNGTNSDCADCYDNSGCCRTFGNLSEGLSEIYCNVQDCCEQTNSNFVITWSLIEECCNATQSTVDACCQETHSLLVEILDTLTQCCDDLADDIFDTQEIIIECCEQTQSNFELTWSLLENLNLTCSLIADLAPVLDGLKDIRTTLTTCCAQDEANFEATWSLIENLNFTCSLILDLAPELGALSDVQNTLTTCCAQNETNFEITWSLINDIATSNSACCELTHSNFEATWSLIENLNFTCSLVVDLTPVLDAVDNVQNTLTTCCATDQTNFQVTTSLLNAAQAAVVTCCEQTQNSFENTWSLINNLTTTCSLVVDLAPALDAIDNVRNTLTTCCAADQDNFVTTWSLIDNAQAVVDACCEQTQSNFEMTWSLINNLNFTCSLTADLTPIVDAVNVLQNTLTACCAADQANFVTTWSILNGIETDVNDCCNSTQSGLENILEIVGNANPFPCGLPTPITTTTIISNPGRYCVKNDITSNQSNGVITISANNVYLDLNEYTIRNTGGSFSSSAINVTSGVNNLTVVNGTVTGNIGINVSSAETGIIKDINCLNCSNLGIYLNNSTAFKILNSNFFGASSSIYLVLRGNHTVDNCHFNNIATSFFSVINIEASNNNHIANCTVKASSAASQIIMRVIGGSTNINLENLTLNNNTSLPLFIDNGNQIIIRNVECSNNTVDAAQGIVVQSSSNVHIAHSLVNNNSGLDAIKAGYNLRSCIDSSIINSIATNHADGSGITIATSSRCSIMNNQLLGNNIGLTIDSSPIFVFNNYGANSTSNFPITVPLVGYDAVLGTLPLTYTDFDNTELIVNI